MTAGDGDVGPKGKHSHLHLESEMSAEKNI